ncbi:SDR family NAD(P)-dependent oxidoreductase [Weissella cibaria]|uniref:SDR family NAD(P)-dependent oxidoreductase n=1 Tax=Weissella cibaria TaxID=137591 RepID=UPI00168051C0|nr:SDR family NAD(P)-dependent oxidoreductase [Weissella cibaria]MBD1502362.1 SDR family oxidoreductase [Weissella cibaria]
MYEGKVILVAGGTGAVGEGIVKYLAENGATVLVPTRFEDKALDALGYVDQPYRKNVFYLFGDISDEADAQKMHDVIVDHFEQLDGMVSSLGGWWQGAALTDITKAEWEELMQGLLTAHFVASNTLMPLLRQGSNYTFISGVSAEDAAFSKYSGPVAPAGAAVLMLSELYAVEMAGRFNVNALVLGPVNTRVRPTSYRKDSYVSSKTVGELIGALHFENANPITGERLRVPDVEAAASYLAKWRG